MKAKNDKAPDAANVGTMVEHADEQTTTQAKASLSIITSITPSTLAKTKTLSADGSITDGSKVEMTKGTALNTTVTGAKELANLLDSMADNQAVTWGIHTGKHDDTKLLSKKLHNDAGKPADTLTRTQDHFTWAQGGGVMMLDCDVKGVSKEQFIKAINDIIPLDTIAHVWRPSASSYIYNDKVQLVGLSGQRLYIFVKDASDIPRAGNNLFERLWLGGHGYYGISAAGTPLVYSLIDASVWQTNRLDLVYGSTCAAPLKHIKEPTQWHEGTAVDSASALPELTGKELSELNALKEKAKSDIANEAHAIKEKYSTAKAMENLASQGIKAPNIEQLTNAKNNVLRALTAEKLTGDFVIYLADGAAVSVGEVLDNPSQYHGKETKDPLEPEYNNHKTVGQLYLYQSKPQLYSQAHGGKTYELIRQPQNIEHGSGQMVTTTDKTLDLMRGLSEYFDLGDQLVSVKDGQVIPLTETLLGYELGGIAQYWQKTNSAPFERRIDPPPPVLKHILSLNKQRNLKPLNAVITAPTITHDGHVVQKRGHDPQTGLYLSTLDDYAPFKQDLSIDDATAAYHVLMKPFDTFNFATDLDRSVALSAILTAVVRPALTKAAGFAFDAPKQGSGKTFLAECLGLLATGIRPAMTPTIQKNEAETSKVLLSMMLRGTRTIVWDNVMGSFDSATLASFLTTDLYSGRILGRSEQIELPNRAMFMMTGNNILLAGELPRRMLTCRLDTGAENPSKVIRDLTATDGLKPDAYIEQNRTELVTAAITIISAYLQSPAGMFGGAAPDVTGSFEHWDKTCRQPIVWLAEHIGELKDPKRSIDANIDIDPEQETLGTILIAIFEWTGSTPFKAKDLLSFADGGFDSDDFAENADSRAELKDALAAMCGSDGTPNSVGVGKALAFRRDRIANGLKLSIAKKSTKGTTFQVIEIDE